jgi:hypothetical protein
MQFHLQAKDRAQHERSFRPESAVEIEITHSSASGLADSAGSFELQLLRRNEISNDWEVVGTATLGVGARTRTSFDALERDAEYAIGVYYKHYNDAIDSELSVDGNITVR